MSKTSLSAIAVLQALLVLTTMGSPLQELDKERHSQQPVMVRPLTHPQGLSKVSLASVRPFYKSKADWQHIIDSTWGPGLPLAQKLAIFDNYATGVANKFDGFLSLGFDWDSLRTHYRSKIDTSTSRGRFAAIMALFAMSLRDYHTWAWDTVVTYTPLAPGVPLLVLYAFATAEHFGAVLTALPDSSALVLRAVPNHPLGLEPGDIVLGYEGVPWKRLVKELLDAELPVYSAGLGTRSAETHAQMRNVGNNWHLFETIDIVKHATGDTLHLSVYPLLNLPPDPMMGNEQLDIAGIPSAFYFVKRYSSTISTIGEPVNYGKLPATDIGYIRLLGEWPTSTTDALFAAAINALWDSKGLIIDMRWNSGGWALFSQAFARMYSQRSFTIDDAYRESPAIFDLVPAGNNDLYVIPGGQGSLYDRPIAVLLGPTCVSMGDVTAQRLRYHPMVRFFGKSTIASLGDSEFLEGHADWLLRYSIGDMYHTSRPGVYLNRSEFPIDESVWFNADDVAQAKDPVIERAIAWMTGLTYAHDVALDRHYALPGLDTVCVTAKLTNPLAHATGLSAIVTDEAGKVRDSLQMFDDGAHGDLSPGDSVWGCRIGAPLAENLYGVAIRTDDKTQGTFRRIMNAGGFATAGPLVLDSLGIVMKVGTEYWLTPFVRNNGKSSTVRGAKLTPKCSDPWVTFITSAPLTLSNVGPGKIATTGVFNIAADSATFPGYFNLKVELSVGGRVYWTDSKIITFTGVGEEKPLPSAYALRQNFPNPFNPSTTIRFELPHSSQAILTVYDVLGREVTVLVNERKDAGVHEVKFDGSKLASGVYFYRLQAGDFLSTKKMLVLK